MVHNISSELIVGVVTAPMPKAHGSYCKITLNLLRVLTPLVDEILIITSNFPEDCDFEDRRKLKLINYKSDAKNNNIVIRMLNSITLQLKISFLIIKYSKNVDAFFILSGALLLPTLVSRILGRKPVITALASESYNSLFNNNRIYLLLDLMEVLTIRLSYKITVESPNVASFLKIDDKFRNKIFLEGPLFIYDSLILQDLTKIRPIDSREELIGFVGRLSGEKGILNYMKSIPILLKERPNLKFLIVGDGELEDTVKNYIYTNNLKPYVNYPGWVPRERVMEYMGQIKLLVIPSYTEGLPNILLEAMACGTPVLAAPVGAIPDLVQDGETGFIMETNSPECIAINTIRALDYPGLSDIVPRARDQVEQEFSYGAVVDKWKKIIKRL